VAAGRLAEVAWAQRNARNLFARGAYEVGAGHYPLIVALHAAWLIAIAALLPRPVVIHAGPLVLFFLLLVGRAWVLTSLGSFFTTRIITLPDAPLVRRGPYRFVNHPNYLVVIGEILVFPFVFGEIAVAVTFSILNAILLYWRIHVENAALAARR
jgi:methyltransferase